MPQIQLCFVWHMHQPYYKDLVTGEYRLPWTRLHALKDYYGVVNILREFPEIRQTFNLVPSLISQVDEYASGKAVDPFLRAALKPAEELSEDEQSFVLQYGFHANPARMIFRYPRYEELYNAWQSSECNFKRARRLFGIGELRDLQVLSQLAWFDEEDFTLDPDIRALVSKARAYTRDDQALLGAKQLKALGRVLPAYASLAATGQIEISTTPFYHPILPLLCDSNIASVAHPYVSLPSQFRYPEDAREQLERARGYMTAKFGVAPVGLWPSEGSVSDEALALAADAGFRWAASDNGVLARTLHREATPLVTYRPYLWEQSGRQMNMLFRDHALSDLVGFVYSRMDPDEAASHFLAQIHDNCREAIANGHTPLVPIILDGENAWEYYDQNGRPFLRALYSRIQQDPLLNAVTVSEALQLIPAERIQHIHPGSWINANFDIWIGAEEDNRAWDCLLRARRAYDQAKDVSESSRRLAYEELLIAEGSDWCWWYGPEHDSANRPEFDQLFRAHLANVYSALGLPAPEDLSRPILHTLATEIHDRPTGLIRPTVDGEVTSYFEWLGAGVYKVDSRSGAMHGQRFIIRELHYGSDGISFYLRVDFEDRAHSSLDGSTVNLQIAPLGGSGEPTSVSMPVAPAGPSTAGGIEYASGHVFEIRVPLGVIGAHARDSVRFQLSLWQNGLPLDALPQQGWLEASTAEPDAWGF